LIISSSATLAEIFRSGILSVEHGQAEAAYSVGLTRGQMLRLVVVPQALRRLSPAIVSQLVALLKGTSLGYVVSYGELLNQGEILGEYSHNLIQTYLVVALMYVVVNASLSRLAQRMETRRSQGGPAPQAGGGDLADAGAAAVWSAAVLDR
jgi:glutamate transport system permease protein